MIDDFLILGIKACGLFALFHIKIQQENDSKLSRYGMKNESKYTAMSF